MNDMNKLKDWLENNEDEIDGGVAFDMIYEKVCAMSAALAAEKPTADEGLVGELKEWIKRHSCMKGGTDEFSCGQDTGYENAVYAVEEILSKYRPVPSLPAAKVEEPLDNGILHYEVICDKAEGPLPLAVLADRKGYEIAQLNHRDPFPNTWDIILRPKGGPRNSWVGENWPDFDSYSIAEKYAREWLEKQEDKK